MNRNDIYEYTQYQAHIWNTNIYKHLYNTYSDLGDSLTVEIYNIISWLFVFILVGMKFHGKYSVFFQILTIDTPEVHQWKWGMGCVLWVWSWKFYFLQQIYIKYICYTEPSFSET